MEYLWLGRSETVLCKSRKQGEDILRILKYAAQTQLHNNRIEIPLLFCPTLVWFHYVWKDIRWKELVYFKAYDNMQHMTTFITMHVISCYHPLLLQALTIILIIRIYLPDSWKVDFCLIQCFHLTAGWSDLSFARKTTTTPMSPCVTHYCSLSTVNPEIWYTTLSHKIQVTKQRELQLFLCSLGGGKTYGLIKFGQRVSILGGQNQGRTILFSLVLHI